MTLEQTKPAALAEQLTALRQVITKTGAALQATRFKFPSGTLEGLTNVETSLDRLIKLTATTEAQYSQLVALAQIGQVVNSTLELDEVLRVVMDTIVHLTRAERGFLMLKDAKGNLVANVARNWEKGTINSPESAVSRTVIQKVVESGEAILTTNAQNDPRLSGQESIVAFNLRSILCVPLKVKDELIGMFGGRLSPRPCAARGNSALRQ
jgi:adenylate cyclase